MVSQHGLWGMVIIGKHGVRRCKGERLRMIERIRQHGGWMDMRGEERI